MPSLEEIQQAVREIEAKRKALIAAGKKLCKKCGIVLHPESVTDYCTVCDIKRNRARWKRF